jgi:predicted transcriptional regulator
MFIKKESYMQVATSEKQNILRAVQSLPEDTSIEEAMERLFFLFKVEKGCNEADSGKTVSHIEAEKRMEKWLK